MDKAQILYCSDCNIVQVTKDIPVCQGCQDSIVSWLVWSEYTEDKEFSDYLEKLSQEYAYQRQFSVR